MSKIQIELENIGKKFGRRRIFSNVNFSFNNGVPLGIAGHNGAGKSTLVKIIANIISSSEGSVKYTVNEKSITKEEIFNHIGFVAPYLTFYAEFSPIENLKFFSQIRGIEFDKNRAVELLTRLNIHKRKYDLLAGFSSGMLQRMKFVFALYHNPEILLLDEPTSNLDDEGKTTVYDLINEYAKDKLIIIASNEKPDLELCGNILELEKYKTTK
jgi:heme exporter protein A